MSLLDCFVELTAYVTYSLENLPDRNLPLADFRDNLISRLSESYKKAEDQGFSEESYNSARFAVLAWIDEAIMESSWSEKQNWPGNSLQRKYYETTKGGVEFYDRLKNLEPDENHVREVYYFCLVSGFTGVYGNSEDQSLIIDEIKSKNLKYLTGTSDDISVSEGMLFKQAYDFDRMPENTSSLKNRLISPLYILGIASPVLIFIFLFFIYKLILNNLIG